MSLSGSSLFSSINRRKFGATHPTIGDSNGLIEKLSSTPDQSHALTNRETCQPTSPNAVHYSYDDTGFVSVGDEDGGIHIYDTLRNKLLIGWSPHLSAILDLLWVPYVPKIISCSADKTIVVSDAWRAQPEVSFVGHSNSVRTVDLHVDNPTTFASGGRDGQVLLWDIRYLRRECSSYHPINKIDTFKKETNDTKHHVKVTSVKFVGDRKLATCADASHIIKVWDTRRTYTNYKRDPLPWHTFCPQSNPSFSRGYTCLSVDEARTSLYASGLNGHIRRFCLGFNASSEVGNYYGHKGSNFYIRTCLSPNGKWLLSGSLCGRAHIWDVTKPGAHLYTLECGSSSEVLSVAWSPFDIDNLVTCSDGDIAFWNMRCTNRAKNTHFYQIEKNENNEKGNNCLEVSENVNVAKKLKLTTLDKYFVNSRPDTLDCNTSQIETERDELNESKSTSTMVESMQHLTVDTAHSNAPIESLNQTVSRTNGNKKYSLNDFFLSTGKGAKRKHSEDTMDS